MSGMTAHALVETLRAHYISPSKPPGGIFATEVPDPLGARRADALWVPMTHAGRGRIIGHELKVSRADLANELADVTKADAWAQYCNQWWLVVSDPDLIDGFDIPPQWGIMAPPSGRRRRSMTVLREAPEVKPAGLTSEAFWRIANWMFHRIEPLRQEATTAKTAAASMSHQVETLRAQLRSLESRVGMSGGVELELAKVLSDKRMQGFRWGQLTPEEIVTVILDIEGARLAVEMAQRALRARWAEFERFIEPLTEERENVRRILQPDDDTTPLIDLKPRTSPV